MPHVPMPPGSPAIGRSLRVVAGLVLLVSIPATTAARQAFADLPGVRLWFTDSGGSGEPVVLLHANTGTSESWAPQTAALTKAGYRAIAFDRRGWGKSTANAATGAQPGSIAEDLDNLATWLGLDRFHLVGIAGGGFAALDYAAWRGDRLRSLVVAASTGSVSEKEIQDFISRIEIPGIRSLPAHFREVGPSYRGADPDGVARWLAIHEHSQQAGAPSQPLRSPNTYAKLGAISVRTLVMPADADLLAPPALMWRWAQHVKGAQWAVVPDAGHSANWERADQFNQHLVRFLGGQAFPAASSVPRP